MALREAIFEREPNRRWFIDDDFDLIVWFDDAATIVAIDIGTSEPADDRVKEVAVERFAEHTRYVVS